MLWLCTLTGKGHQLIYNPILFGYQSASVKISLVLLQLQLKESHSKLQTQSWSTVKATKAGLPCSLQLGCCQQAYKCVKHDLTLLLHVYQIARYACCQWQVKCSWWQPVPEHRKPAQTWRSIPIWLHSQLFSCSDHWDSMIHGWQTMLLSATMYMQIGLYSYISQMEHTCSNLPLDVYSYCWGEGAVAEMGKIKGFVLLQWQPAYRHIASSPVWPERERERAGRNVTTLRYHNNS